MKDLLEGFTNHFTPPHNFLLKGFTGLAVNRETSLLYSIEAIFDVGRRLFAGYMASVGSKIPLSPASSGPEKKNIRL